MLLSFTPLREWNDKAHLLSGMEHINQEVKLLRVEDNQIVDANKRDWKVRSANGSIMPVARGNIRPWLGI